MSDQTDPPVPPDTPAGTPEGGAAAGGSSGPGLGALVAIGLIVAVVAFGTAFALSAATEPEPEPAATAADVLAAGGGAAEIPVLQPTSEGGFVHPDVLAAQTAGEPETADVPAEGAGPTFEVAEGEPATADVIVTDDAFPEGDAGVVEEVVAPVRPEPRVLWPGLDEVAEPLALPETDDIDGSDAPAEGGPGTTSTTASPGGSSPGPTLVTGPDEIELEIPGLVDVCAEDPSLPFCGPGLGGTIIPTDHELLTVSGVVAAPTERCGAQVGSVARDRVALMILSNDLGRFEVGYRDAADADGELITTDVTTPDSEVPYAERHERVQTCVIVDRLGDADHYDVVVTPSPLGDDAPSLPWEGMIQIYDAGARPPVRLEPRDDRTLEAYVPAAEGEVVEVWTIPRDDAPESACEQLDERLDAEGTRPTGIAQHPEVNRVPLATTAGTSEFTTVRQHDVYLTDESATDLCIIWYRDLAPEREVVERQSWLLLPPAHPEALFVATEFVDAAGRGVRLHGGDYRGVIVDVENAAGRSVCNAGIFIEDLAEAGEELFCSFEVTPERAAMALVVSPISPPDIPEPGAYRGAVELRSDPCYDVGGCTETYAVGVPGPPIDGERTVLGTFRFEVRYTDAPIRSAEWVTAATGTFDTPEREAVDHVQLDLGNTRVVAHPFDPFKVLLEWQTDREVEAAWASGEAIRAVPCRTGESPNAVRNDGESTFEGDHGVVVLSVCPGTAYEFALSVNDGETVHTWKPSPDTSEGPRPEYRWRDGAYRTETVSLSISLDLRTRAPGGLAADARVVPMESERSRGAPEFGEGDGTWDIRYIWVQVGDEIREPENAYGTFECGSPAYHDTAVSEPYVVEAGPTLGFTLSTQIYRFSACGLFGNVPATAGGKKADWRSSIIRSVPVGDLVDGQWRLQDWAWSWPNLGAKCAGRPYIQLTDARTGREAAQKAQEFNAWVEGLGGEDEGPREVGGAPVEAGRFCNPPPNHRVTMTIDTELAGVVNSAAGGVETAAG